jgi:hypothetical protein
MINRISTKINTTIHGSKHGKKRPIYIMVFPYMVIAVLLLALLLPCLPVSAFAIASPDSITILNYRVFDNVFHMGDMLFVFEDDIDYSTTPVPVGYTPDQLFTAELLQADGMTVVTDTVTPAQKSLLYFQYGLSAFYFTAADVTAYGLTWATNYWIRISGTALFDVLPTPVKVQVTAGYKVHSATKAGTAINIRSYMVQTLVKDLETQNGEVYLVKSTNGYVLNADGRALVIGIIPYLDTPVPLLFQTAIQQIVVTQTAAIGTLDAQLSLGNQLGTQLAASFTNFGLLLHISGQQVALGWIMICILIIVSIVFLATQNLVGAGICAIPMVIIGTWIGAIPLAFLFTGIIVLVVMLVFYLIIRGM